MDCKTAAWLEIARGIATEAIFFDEVYTELVKREEKGAFVASDVACYQNLNHRYTLRVSAIFVETSGQLRLVEWFFTVVGIASTDLSATKANKSTKIEFFDRDTSYPNWVDGKLYHKLGCSNVVSKSFTERILASPLIKHS